MSNQKELEARIKYLVEELHKANMEINRLVLENAEQDFTIFRLKRMLNTTTAGIFVLHETPHHSDAMMHSKEYKDYLLRRRAAVMGVTKEEAERSMNEALKRLGERMGE